MKKSAPKKKGAPWAMILVGVLVLAAAGLGMNALRQNSKQDDMDTAAMNQMQMQMPMPDWLQGASTPVKDAYMWAAVHQDDLQYIPCYCGCNHASNAACFFKRREDGTIAEYDEHALNCSTCVEIAQSTRQSMAKGKKLTVIRQQIDKSYQGRGLTGTNTPMPPAGL